MDIEVTVRAGRVSDRMKDVAREKVARIGKFFDRVGGVHVTLDAHAKDDHGVHVVAHLDTGATLVADARQSDLRAAIEDVSDNLVRQVRREKERLIDRNRKGRAGKDELPAPGQGDESEPTYEDVLRDDLDK